MPTLEAMSTVAHDVDYQRLNSLLWRYRPLLDRFEFLLEMQLLVTASARDDWLHHVTDLLDELADELNGLDLEREVVLGAGPTISSLAETAPEPWAEILTEQVAHFASATSRIGQLRRRNQQMIEASTAGLAQLFEGLAEAAGYNLSDSGDSYDGDGRRRSGGGSSLLFDGRA
jgi:hypothetical protein